MQTLAVGAIVSDQQLVDHLYDQNGMFSASIFIERQMSCPVNEIFSEKEKENFVANAATLGNQYLEELGITIRIKYVQGEPDGTDLLWQIEAI
jgi:hypothetical protein